eukprot:bmy_13009T0
MSYDYFFTFINISIPSNILATLLGRYNIITVCPSSPNNLELTLHLSQHNTNHPTSIRSLQSSSRISLISNSVEYICHLLISFTSLILNQLNDNILNYSLTFFSDPLSAPLLILTIWLLHLILIASNQTERLNAGLYFLFYTLIGSLPLLVTLTYLLNTTGSLNFQLASLTNLALPPTINLIGELLTIILIGTNIVITALYSLYILITTQCGKHTHHINNIIPSFTREHALIALHVIPLLFLSLNPKIILGPLYCRYSLKRTLDCESSNRRPRLLIYLKSVKPH